ncbi:MAG: hypothetical protein ACREXT_16825 [Gammaproteobacteria bacterium]
MRSPRFILISILCAPCVANAALPFEFTPPDFLASPVLTRAATSNTYRYSGNAPYPDVELRLTVVEIPADLSRSDATPCLEAFITELRNTLPQLFAAHDPVPMALGSLTVNAWRWTSRDGDRLRTGVLSCGIHRNRYIAVAFQDRLTNARHTFPAIRAALSQMVLP